MESGRLAGDFQTRWNRQTHRWGETPNEVKAVPERV
jgi:hypothetical protein